MENVYIIQLIVRVKYGLQEVINSNFYTLDSRKERQLEADEIDATNDIDIPGIGRIQMTQEPEEPANVILSTEQMIPGLNRNQSLNDIRLMQYCYPL